MFCSDTPSLSFSISKFMLLAETIRSRSLLSAQRTSYNMLYLCCTPDINNINYGWACIVAHKTRSIYTNVPVYYKYIKTIDRWLLRANRFSGLGCRAALSAYIHRHVYILFYYMLCSRYHNIRVLASAGVRAGGRPYCFWHCVRGGGNLTQNRNIRSKYPIYRILWYYNKHMGVCV